MTSNDQLDQQNAPELTLESAMLALDAYAEALRHVSRGRPNKLVRIGYERVEEWCYDHIRAMIEDKTIRPENDDERRVWIRGLIRAYPFPHHLVLMVRTAGPDLDAYLVRWYRQYVTSPPISDL